MSFWKLTDGSFESPFQLPLYSDKRGVSKIHWRELYGFVLAFLRARRVGDRETESLWMVGQVWVGEGLPAPLPGSAAGMSQDIRQDCLIHKTGAMKAAPSHSWKHLFKQNIYHGSFPCANSWAKTAPEVNMSLIKGLSIYVKINSPECGNGSWHSMIFIRTRGSQL